MKRLTCLIVFLITISCGDSKKVEERNNNSSKEKILAQSPVLFDKEGAVEILDFKMTNDYPSSEKDTTICKSWNLSTNDIEKLINESEAINGPDWHHLFEHLPCSITGKLKQTNKTFGFQINGGAWMTITDNDTTLYYGYFKKDGDRLFISTPMDAETGE